jgi:DNA processing protein
MTALKGIGAISIRRILDSLESPEQFFYLKPIDIQHLTGLSARTISNCKRDDALQKADKIIDQHLKNNVKCITIEDNQYPESLIHCPDAPVVIYSIGSSNLNETRSVSIVGTRKNSAYGERVTKKIVDDLSGEIDLIVSGLAKGIDTIAHTSSIEKDIKTLAVLGHGLDRVYPKSNSYLARKIIEKGGALISEFPFGVKPDRENFPKRNRIVAGMTNATIVVESSSKGGALITARLALDYNRDVFAVPGPLFKEASIGTNNLIKNNGASLFSDTQQFLIELGWKTRDALPRQGSLPISLNETQESLLKLIREKGPISIDNISRCLNLSISKLNTELLSLELRGVINCLPGCNYSV